MKRDTPGSDVDVPDGSSGRSGIGEGLSLWAHGLIFVIIMAPVVLLAVFGYAKNRHDLTQAALSRHEVVASLAAVNLKSKFDGLVVAAQSYTDDQQFRAAVDAGEWEEAVTYAEKIRRSVPGIGHVFLTDTAGVLRAELPALGAVGQSLAYRDWYQGVTRSWTPYVSNVYMRSDLPQASGVAVAIPVRSYEGPVKGILVLQIQLDTFLEWSRDLDVGEGAIVFFADRDGQPAPYPNAERQDRIGIFSTSGPVRKALADQKSGAATAGDPFLYEDAVFALAAVPVYGWTAVVEQSQRFAFAERNANLRGLLLAYAIDILLQIVLAIFILGMIARLVAQRNRERLFLENIGDGLFITDADGSVVSMNKAAEQMLGLTLKESKGKDFTDVITVLDDKGNKVPRTKRPLTRALRGHKSSEKLLLQGADQKPFPASFTVTPVSVRGKVTGAVLVFRDITQEEDLDRAKREFVSIASHQLLTPVSSSKGYLSMLLAGDIGKFNDEQKEYLAKLYELNQHAVDLIDDLLNLSRVELGVLESTIEPIDMASFLRAEVRAQEANIKARGIVLEERYDPVLPPLVIPSRLVRIIVQNLLSNAVKYTPVHGQIQLELSYSDVDGPGVLLSVIDTGCGIPMKERDRIFEKFFRAENARAAGVEGTGLGLYIVKSVVNVLRGKIWFESTMGKGTSFHVRIPAKIAEA